uniref:Uncharacterized protein LOC109548309 n=1 Tax=Tursiops truncatus TaxID=9739 RepID=A0A6J3Q9S0_TURTR|nr:uncharacterized protein LOC109548309 [Tursiops truncatus]
MNICSNPPPRPQLTRIFVPQANLFQAGKSSAAVAFFICVLTAWERVAAATRRKERAAEHPSGEVRCPRRRWISAVPPCMQLHTPWRRLPSRVGDPSPFSRSVAAGLRPAEGSVETPTAPAPGGHARKPSVRTHARCRRQAFKQFPGSPSSRVTVPRKGAGDRNEIFNKSVPQNENELSFSILSSGDTLFPLKESSVVWTYQLKPCGFRPPAAKARSRPRERRRESPKQCHAPGKERRRKCCLILLNKCVHTRRTTLNQVIGKQS